MRTLLLAFCGLVILAVPAFAQSSGSATDSTAASAAATPPAATPAAPVETGPDKKWYFGGSVGLSFGSYQRFSISPIAGRPINPKVSLGLKGTYEYIKDTRYGPTLTASNYGGSAFTRFHIHPLAYAHAEFAYMSYEYKVAGGTSDRTWVPFVYLGGGVMKPIGPHMAAFVEVLFDVLQDGNSPYDAWQPMVSVGVTKGI